MNKLKLINWKLVVYWFIAFSLINTYLIPKFVTHEPITAKRVVVGVLVSLVVALVMGLAVAYTKPEDKSKT